MVRVADGDGALLGELEEVTLGAGDTVGTPLLDVDPVRVLELDGDAAALLDVDPVGEFDLDTVGVMLFVEVGELEAVTLGAGDTVAAALLEVDPVGELELEGEAAALLDLELEGVLGGDLVGEVDGGGDTAAIGVADEEALPPTQRPKPATRAMERTTRG